MAERPGQYLPLWHASKSAIASYLFCPQALIGGEDIQWPFSMVAAGFSPADIFAQDMKSIRAVTKELHVMAQSGRRLFLVCPVHYQTLKTEHFFLEYVGQCRKIPEVQGRYLIFMVLGIPDDVSQLDLQRYVTTLKKSAYRVYGQVEEGGDVNVHVLKEGRLDAIGFCLSQKAEERVLIKLMEFQIRHAQASGFTDLFLLNVSTLSLATSAICSGYAYLGGKVVHKFVRSPDHILRFKNENLFDDIVRSLDQDDGKAGHV